MTTVARPQAPPLDRSGLGAALHERRPLGDRAFSVLALASGALVLVILVLILLSTTQQSTLWFTTVGIQGVFGATWDPAHHQYGSLPFIFGSIGTAIIAVIISVPLSIGIALLLTEVVSPLVARPIVSVIDLLAVVPSVVFGLWGFLIFGPWIAHFYAGVGGVFENVPVLSAILGTPTSGFSFLTAGIILAVMILPIVTSLSREVFATVPKIDKEGAYALGATRLEMIQAAVWPHSRAGVVGAILLGVGRAMGETIAAALVIGSSPAITLLLFHAGYSMPAVIANEFGEASGVQRSALIGLGVLLFGLTIIINLAARLVFVRAAERRGSR